MINIFKKKNQLYSELSPTERIPKFIAEYIFPALEKEGFKILKSGISIKRDVHLFQQEIWFSKSKWNFENEICAFTPHFSVSIKGYSKWHTKQYSEKPQNNILDTHAANYINSWNNKLFDGNDYDLAKDDNKLIIQLLNDNIYKFGIKFLNILSNYVSAIDFLQQQECYFIAPKMIDICLMHEDLERARTVRNWFRSYERTGVFEFMKSTLNDVDKRESRLTGS